MTSPRTDPVTHRQTNIPPVTVAAPPTDASPDGRPAPGRRPAPRQRLDAAIEAAGERRAAGVGGAAVAAGLSDAVDAVLGDLFAAALDRRPDAEARRLADRVAVLAVGGSGRREAAPHSDVDVLLLTPAAALAADRALCADLVRDAWDAGLKLGHAVRTPAAAIAAARADVTVATALTSARSVCGSERQADRFLQRVARWCHRHGRSFCSRAVAARRAERRRFGDTPNRLEPDVKRTAGGLRDAHLLRWVGFSTFGTGDLELLHRLGAISRADRAAVRDALDVILGVRCDLHLRAGRAHDTLTRTDQLRLAERPPWSDPPPDDERRGDHQPPAVERFMRDYLAHATALSEAADRFVAAHRPRTLGTRVKRRLRPRTAAGLKVGPNTLHVPAADRHAVAADPVRTLAVFETAVRTGSLPDPRFSASIRAALPDWPGEVPPAAAASFRTILAGLEHVPTVLRSLHRHGVLAWLMPDWAHTTNLPQFNQYHSYTVDEHSLRCVEACTDLLAEDGHAGGVRRAVADPAVLNLAVLLHDAGKGYGRDHSEVGGEIAGRVAGRLGWPDADRAALVYLIAHHLRMTHLVFRRDVSDAGLVIEFARAVGGPERLRMLYCLSVADLRGVGPDTWTAWKGRLLAGLFDRARRVLDGGRPDAEEDLGRRIADLADRFAAGRPDRESGDRDAVRGWAAEKLAHFAPHTVTGRPADRLLADLAALRDLPDGGVRADGRFDPATGTVEYRVVIDGRPDVGVGGTLRGLFHRLARALADLRLDVLDATVESADDGSVLDTFTVADEDFPPPAAGTGGTEREAAEAASTVPVPDWRIHEVCRALERAVREPHDDRRPSARYGESAVSCPLPRAPAEVMLDNHASDRCTVIDVFAADRPGLLATLARTLAEQGCRIRLAKISTHLDQVVDVFYVTDVDGHKLPDDRLAPLWHALDGRLREFESTP